MTDADNAKLWLDAAFREYDALRKEMLHFLDNFRRDTTILGGVLAGVFTFQISSVQGIQHDAIVLIVPSIIFAYFLLQVCNLHMSSAEAHACARIERKINDRIGGWPMDWESRIAVRTVRSLTTPVAIAAGALMIALMSLYIAIAFVAYTKYGWWTVILHGLELLLMITSFAIYSRFELKYSDEPPLTTIVAAKGTKTISVQLETPHSVMQPTAPQDTAAATDQQTFQPPPRSGPQ